MRQLEPGDTSAGLPPSAPNAPAPRARRGSRSRGGDARLPARRLGRYLRWLRESRGLTLRHVERRSSALGTAIDNSQLSRFERGKAIPSFAKLRALARVFEVPVQGFADLLDLEPYDRFRPASDDFAELMRRGGHWLIRGEPGRAFVTYERARDVAQREADPEVAAERAAEARVRMASALRALGKPSMTEHELRAVLRERRRLSPRARQRTLLQLVHLYRDRGDVYLATVLARECLDLVRSTADRVGEAMVRNTLGELQGRDGDPGAALLSHERALELLREAGGPARLETRVLGNIGRCLVAMSRFEQGARVLRETYDRARAAGQRRTAALALSRLASAFCQQGRLERGRQILIDSDALVSRAGALDAEILFRNAFQRWTIAREQANDERAAAALERLRRLRSKVQRRFDEVDQYDRHVQAMLD